VAKQLIDFDRELSAMMGARPKTSPDDHDGVDPVVFQQYFQQHGRFTAGVATQYRPSMLIGGDAHQHLATGFGIGMRFHSAPVVRLADAKPLHLGHVVEADGRWRLFLFGDALRPDDPESRLSALCAFLLADPRSPVLRHTPNDADIDAAFDVRAVLQHGHRTLTIRDVPPLLRPTKGRLGLVDHEKVFCPDPTGPDIFDLRGVDRDRGVLIVVRPDQHIGHVLPLDAVDELTAFFAAFMLPAG
jgi:phenol 2-monooxygenase